MTSVTTWPKSVCKRVSGRGHYILRCYTSTNSIPWKEKMANEARVGDGSSSDPAFLKLFVQLTVLFTLLPFLYLVELHYLGEPPLDAMLWSQGPDRFGDFWHYRALLQLLHRPEFFAAHDRFAYPAPCAILYQWLYHFTTRPHVAFNLLVWITEGVSAVLLYRALVRRGMGALRAVGLLVLLTITSYPWHFLYDRGNIEVFVYVFIAGGVWAWLVGKNDVAAVLWGIAASLKIYPIVLLGMFLYRNLWRPLLLGLASFAAVLLLSFWYVGPNIEMAALGTASGLLGFLGHYGGQARGADMVFDHSILGGVKECLALPVLAKLNVVSLFSHLYEGAVILLAPGAFLLWRRTAPALNQLCLLLLALMLFPPVSYDYTLIYAYLLLGIVLCCALEAARRGETFRGARSYMIAFAILCTAETWISFHGLRPNGLLKCIALLMVAANVLRFPLHLYGLQGEESYVPDQSSRDRITPVRQEATATR